MPKKLEVSCSRSWRPSLKGKSEFDDVLLARDTTDEEGPNKAFLMVDYRSLEKKKATQWLKALGNATDFSNLARDVVVHEPLIAGPAKAGGQEKPLREETMGTGTNDWRHLLTPEELAAYDAGKYEPVDTYVETSKGTRPAGIKSKAPRVIRKREDSSYTDEVASGNNKNVVGRNDDWLQHHPRGNNGDGTYRTVEMPDPDYAYDSDDPHLQAAALERKEILSEGPGDGVVVTYAEGVEESLPAKPTKYESEHPERRPLNNYQGDDLEDQSDARAAIEAIAKLACQPWNCTMCGRYIKGGKSRITVVLHGEGQEQARVFCPECWSEFNVPMQPPDDWQSGWSPVEVAVWNLYAANLTGRAIKAALLEQKLGDLSQPSISRLVTELKSHCSEN